MSLQYLANSGLNVISFLHMHLLRNEAVMEVQSLPLARGLDVRT